MTQALRVLNQTLPDVLSSPARCRDDRDLFHLLQCLQPLWLVANFDATDVEPLSPFTKEGACRVPKKIQAVPAIGFNRLTASVDALELLHVPNGLARDTHRTRVRGTDKPGDGSRNSDDPGL